MIAYLDTSALVPVVLAEPSSPSCRRLWELADDVVTSRLALVEASAALAAAGRAGRLSSRAERAVHSRLGAVCAELALVEVSGPLVARAVELARDHALRGADAVHCASAESVAGPDLVAAAGDRRLLAAWAAVGLATYDTNP